MTPTPTPEQFLNVSNGTTSGFANSMKLTSVIVLVLIGVILLALAVQVSPILGRSRILSRLGNVFLASLEYAFKGLATAFVLGAVLAPFAWFATADSGTQRVSLMAVGATFGVFVSLVALGWVGEQVVIRYVEAHPEHDTVEDIFPDSPDKEREVDV